MNTKNSDLKILTQLYCCKFSKDFGKLIFTGGSNSRVCKIINLIPHIIYLNLSQIYK